MLKHKGKHTLHKSHVLLTAVEFVTLEASGVRAGAHSQCCVPRKGVELEAVWNHSFAQSNGDNSV